MPRTRPMFTAIAITLVLGGSSLAVASDALDDAKGLLAKKDPYAAVERIEAALPDAEQDRLPELIRLLRSAYEQAAAKAESEGKSREAKHYREGLKLIDPSPTAKESPVAEPKPTETPHAPVALEKAPEEAPREPEATKPSNRTDELRKADAAWKAKEYLKAGEIYSTLAKNGNLPESRKDHWAYCRLVAVLERVNASPRTAAEWAEIHAEIDHIRVLAPKNWYGEYLRNVVIERSGGVRKAKQDALVLRGAAPDEKAVTTQPAKTKAQPKAAPPRTSPLDPAPEPEPKPIAPARVAPDAEATIGRPAPAQGNWQVFMTANFRIFHTDEALARKAAVRAETARRAAAHFWTGAEPASPWTPKCDLYLYPTAAIFSEQTQQPPESPGFSTAGLEGGRVTARLVKLRADYSKMLDAVLPHEVTHIVLADLFPHKQIPRWADEGMAVLSEPAVEQTLRARDLTGPIRDDVLFKLDVLMTADYPGGSHWALYYAQSVSLTRFLVGLGTPRQFVEFVRATQTRGIDVALRETYSIEGVAQLESRWKGHVRDTLNPATAAAPSASDTKTR